MCFTIPSMSNTFFPNNNFPLWVHYSWSGKDKKPACSLQTSANDVGVEVVEVATKVSLSLVVVVLHLDHRRKYKVQRTK